MVRLLSPDGSLYKIGWIAFLKKCLGSRIYASFWLDTFISVLKARGIHAIFVFL